jgi:hypothetical protein
MGHAIAGGGFFAIEVELLAESEQGAFSAMVYAAIVKFKSSPLSATQLADELKHMVDDHWDWQVCKLTKPEFSVIFPSQATLRMGTRSGKLFLPLNKVEVSIRKAFLDPQAFRCAPFHLGTDLRLAELYDGGGEAHGGHGHAWKAAGSGFTLS